MLRESRADSGKSVPSERPCTRMWTWEEYPQCACLLHLLAAWVSQGVLLCGHQYSASSNTIIKTVFSDLLLLPYLGNSIQMQIDLNPINPLNHVCDCVCLRVHPRICEHVSHTYLHLYIFSQEHLNPQRKISKWGEMLIFPGNFINCSCAYLINIS